MTSERVTDWSVEQVDGLLRERGIAVDGQVTYLSSGHWSDCFGFRSARQDLVVRIGRHLEDFRKDQRASAWRSTDLPAPTVIDVGDCEGGFYAVSTRSYGRALEQSTDWPRLVNPLVDLLEALRAVDVSELVGWGMWSVTGLPAASSWREFLLGVNDDSPTNRVHGWSERLPSFSDAAATFEWGYELLEARIVEDVPRSLIHNDLYHRNVHVSNGQITGVFDWGNSIIGDHLYDIAMLCFWSPWFDHLDHEPVWLELQRRWQSQRPIADLEQRFQVCMLHIGLEHIGYHAYLDNEAEADAVADRLRVVVDRRWR